MTPEEQLVFNAVATMRTQFMNKLLDTRRDIDDECGYPKIITANQYRLLYDREGIAERVVNVYPFESWALDPEIVETDEAATTPFEQAWQDLCDRMRCFSYLQRVDELSGIGHYGLLLLGLDDGAPLDEPVEGMDDKGGKVGQANHRLLYLRAFDESLVDVAGYETDPLNPRFGEPTFYNVTFYDPNTQESGAVATQDQTTKRVHWSRVIHVADNRKSSEVFGVPRMRPVYNRLYDLRKLLGGSAEMFWKGAFPGYSFEVSPDMGDVEIDSTALREEFDSYSNGLQRYLALSGVQAKSLAPQVASPAAHIEGQIQAIAITLGVPMRVFTGSEQAQLASGQDARAWNRRLDRRREQYLTPFLVRPYIDRLIAFGVLPEPTEYRVVWPDLAAPTEADKAGIAVQRTEAFSKYVAGGVDSLVPPMEYLTLVAGMSQDEAEAIMEAAYDHILAANPDADPDSIVPPREPSGGADGEEDQPQPGPGEHRMPDGSIMADADHPPDEPIPAPDAEDGTEEEEPTGNAADSYKPTAGMVAEAKRGLAWRSEHGRGGTAVGIARARDIANGKRLPMKTVKRMHSFFARHAVDKKGKGFSPGDGYPSNGRIAWALWGGDAGASWAAKIARRADNEAPNDEGGDL